MTKENRIALIKQIEDETNSRLICYVLGDRRGLETKIAPDIFPLFYEHLLSFGHPDTINLLLYAAGGDIVAGWGLVNLIREFSSKLIVTFPFKGYSCATLVALGADEIIMTRGAQMSPIDPSIGSPYNPPAPGIQQPGAVSLLPVSVEDVIGYLNMARVEAGLKGEEALSKVVALLSEKVHPMALGAVYRAREQITTLGTRLLKFHMEDDAKVSKIVDLLTKGLPTHNYLIGRKEAKDIVGLNIKRASPVLEDALWQLYKEYERWLELTIAYNPEAVLGANQTAIGTFSRAVLESRTNDGLHVKTHVFRTQKELRRVQTTQPGIPVPITGVQERILSEGWTEEGE